MYVRKKLELIQGYQADMRVSDYKATKLVLAIKKKMKAVLNEKVIRLSNVKKATIVLMWNRMGGQACTNFELAGSSKQSRS
jgi:hypothetical protein